MATGMGWLRAVSRFNADEEMGYQHTTLLEEPGIDGRGLVLVWGEACE